MSPDFLDMLSALSDAEADFLVVGAHALAAHGVPRATGDLDLWVRPTPANARAVHRALAAFGAPLETLAVEELTQPEPMPLGRKILQESLVVEHNAYPYRIRSAVHVVLSLGAAAVVLALEPVPAAVVLAAATFVALTVELARQVAPAFAAAFDQLGGMLKDRERTGLTGATTLSVGFTLTALLLPGSPALAGLLFAGLADPAAGVVGRRYGRLRYPGGKSVAGSVAFLVVVLGIGLGLGAGPGAAILVAGALTLLEAFTLRIDDNLYLPLAGAALAAWVGGLPPL